jgi:hypothetical protein
VAELEMSVRSADGVKFDKRGKLYERIWVRIPQTADTFASAEKILISEGPGTPGSIFDRIHESDSHVVKGEMVPSIITLTEEE